MPGQVVANGPVNFTDAQGRAISIPLVLLAFDADGIISAESWPPHAEYGDPLYKWLEHLQEQGFLREGESPPQLEAMIVTAKTPGAAGNTILLDIDNVRPDPADASVTIFDAVVTETNAHSGLTPETLKAVVGEAAGGGSSPGLVFVSSTGDPEMPRAGEYPLTGGGATAASDVEIPNEDESATAFTLSARSVGEAGDNTTVTIEEVDAAASTFTLVATWTDDASGLEPGELEAEFAYEITVAPPDGGALAAPAAGEYALGGGADAQGAKAASVTLIARP